MSNILLADDHSIVRSGIKALIKENLGTHTIDEAASEDDVVRLIKGRNYHLIILDINMGNADFVKLMEWLHAVSPSTPVLVFTMHPEEIYGMRSLQLGATGYLRKTASDAEILNAIKTMLGGKKYINFVLAEIMLHSSKNKQSTNPFQGLSSREIEIAMLLNSGTPLPNICIILNIQYSTANTYKRRIFEKLNVNNVLSLPA